MYDIQARLRTGEVAEAAGVNIQTLRYYERRGLIAEPARSPGGHRTYPPDTVVLLNVIKAAQRLGFTLDEVAELLDTGRRRHPSADLKQRAQRQNRRGRPEDRRPAHHPRRPDTGDRGRLRQPDQLHLPRLPDAVRRPGRPEWRPPMTTPATEPKQLHQHLPIDNSPPKRSKITGGLAALACAACCAIPLLIAFGLVTGTGAALLEQTLLAVAAGLAVLALGMWWLHRRRQAAKAKAAGGGCADGNCSC